MTLSRVTAAAASWWRSRSVTSALLSNGWACVCSMRSQAEGQWGVEDRAAGRLSASPPATPRQFLFCRSADEQRSAIEKPGHENEPF